MQKILIVEDEYTIAETIELFLKKENYKTERAGDGHRALELWRAFQPDLIVLDIGLPELDGLEVLKTIRTTDNVPIVILTARSEEIDQVLGLGLGADDYMTKPFSPRVLVAHIKAVLKRNQQSEEPQAVIRVSNIEINNYEMSVRVGESLLNLTPTEYKLLHHLAKTPGKVISRWELFEASMPDSDALERAVDTHIKNLRQKLDDAGAKDVIATVWGAGYRLSL